MKSHPFRFLRSFGRSREIVTVLIQYGFGDIVDRMGLRKYLQWGKRLFSRKRKVRQEPFTRGERIRMSLESLGATFIKFGQVASTRPDLIPADVIRELEKLQESVPPFSSEQAVRLITQEFGIPPSELFAEFDLEPLAAGSLGQVHRAKLHDGTPVAVKIRRPKVVRNVERDLALMMELAILAERHIPEAEIFDPVGLVTHFSRTIRREMNFFREGRNMEEFARLFRHDATLKVPRVFWDLTTEGVLTMEFVDGLKVSDVEPLKQAGIATEQVAANGARIFMKQAFELGLFHGDPHPGNIRIMLDGSICLLDYGMVGSIEEEQRDRLIDLFAAVAKKDVKHVVQLIQLLGNPVREVDAPLLRADVRDFVENYYGISLDRLNVSNMLTDFVSILSQHAIRCPSDLLLLIRALVTLEGVGAGLDPEFNMAEQLAPFVEQMVRDRYSPKRIADRVVEESKLFLQLAHDVPLHLGRTLDKLSRDELKIQLEHRKLDHLVTELDRSSNRVVISLVMSSLIIASALILRQGVADWTWKWLGLPFWVWLTLPIYIISSMLGVWLIYGVFRSGRL